MAEANAQAPQAGAPAAPAAAPAAPVAGTPEYDAAMAAKFDATQPQAAPAAEPARPAWLPEKFKTVEDMAKAYTALESKLGTPTPPKVEAPATDPNKAPAVDPKAALQVPQGEADKAVADAGFDMAKLQAEYAEHGDLTPETRTALEAKFGKATVDGYIAGQQALAEKFVSQVHAAAGGEEQLGQMLTWAKTGLPVAEQVAFNDAMASGDVNKANLAVAGLKGRFEAQHGSLPSLVQGGAGPADSPYESMAQVTADMRKPEYQKDPAFRAKVERRIAASDKLYTVQERS